ncbi:MAG: DMT family transporter, partial [Solirubrobacteraceae bacterium]
MPRFAPSLTAALAWGAMFPIAAPALDRIDPFHLTAVRYLVAVAVFVALLRALEGRRAFRLEGRALELWALGSAGFAGFNLLVYVALEHTRPQDAALIVATSPVLVVLTTWALGMGRPR